MTVETGQRMRILCARCARDLLHERNNAWTVYTYAVYKETHP